DRSICRDFAADNGQNTVQALTLCVIEQRVLPRNLSLAHTFLAHQRANTGPGEVDLIEGGARESVPRFLLEIADVLLGRGDLAGITVVVGVRGADDRRVSPGDNEEEPPVALREENVRLLHRTAGDEVHALCQSDEPLDEWDLCVVEAPRSGEPVRLKRRLRRERVSAVEVLPPRKALVQ